METIRLNFPVWAIGTLAVSPTGTEGHSVVRMNDPRYGSCLPIFTGKNIAIRFIQTLLNDKAAEHHPIEIETAPSLKKIVIELAQRGCRFVAIDFLHRKQRTSVYFVSVALVIDACGTIELD